MMRAGSKFGFAVLAISTCVASFADAQTAAPPPTPATPIRPLSDPAVAAVLSPNAAKPLARRCMRLPLSDIAVGRPETIALAQLRLGEYAVDEAKKRKWSGALVKSDEKIECENYLYLPIIGQEYKCLVTATFCVK